MSPRKQVVDGVIVESKSNTSLIVSTADAESMPLTPSTVDLRKMIDAAVSERDWIQMFQTARDAALNGDKASRDFLVKYRFGLPVATPPNQAQRKGVTVLEIEKTREPTEDD